MDSSGFIHAYKQGGSLFKHHKWYNIMAQYVKRAASATGPRAHSLALHTEDNIEYLLYKPFGRFDPL